MADNHIRHKIQRFHLVEKKKNLILAIIS